MESNTTTCESCDILSSRRRVFFPYWLPAIAIVVAGALAMSSGWRTAVWTVGLATMGVACIVNALRCGRVHCYLTGPIFLLMALAALSYGLGILRLRWNGWNLLGLITLIGAFALWCLPEMFFGQISEGSRDKSQRPLIYSHPWWVSPSYLTDSLGSSDRDCSSAWVRWAAMDLPSSCSKQAVRTVCTFKGNEIKHVGRLPDPAHAASARLKAGPGAPATKNHQEFATRKTERCRVP